MTAFLLDTDVLSEVAAGPARNRAEKVFRWMRSLGSDTLALSSVAISESIRGVAMLRKRNPKAADILEAKLAGIMAAHADVILTPSHDEWRTFAKLSAIPELLSLCHGKNKRNTPRTGADIFLCVQAAANSHAVATFNTADYMLIDAHFPLVNGVFNPATNEWVRPREPGPDACEDGWSPPSP